MTFTVADSAMDVTWMVMVECFWYIADVHCGRFGTLSDQKTARILPE